MNRPRSDVGAVLKSAISPSSLYVFAMVNGAMAPIVFVAKFHLEISKQLGMPDVFISSLYGLFFVIGGSVNFWVQRRVAQLAMHFCCAAAGSFLAAGLVACAHSQNAAHFLISFFVLISALGGAFFLAPIASFAMTRSGSASALALGIATAGQLTSFGVWAFAIRALGLEDWRDAFRFAAVVIAALAALGIIVLKPAKMTVTPNLPIETGRLHIVYLHIVYLLVCFIATELILYLTSLSISLNGTSVYFFSASALAGRVVVSAIFDVGFRRLSIVFAGATFALGTISFLLTSSIIASFLSGFGYGALLPVLMTFIYLRYPAHKQRSSYEMFAFGSVGILAAPFLDKFDASMGLPAPLFVVWSIPLMILISYYFLKDPFRSPPPPIS